ncbi:MAG: NADH-quinone oxidoreductase subunit [Acidobacteriota bacterium]|nr:NADH-quinone oxidoreductase subunit [Acidobacteriota bacterium]
MTLSGWESIFFWVFAVAAMIAALLTVLAKNAVHSALFLISTLVAVAALFILLGAEFIAGVQILVYVGGVMVLFLFVIMLVNVSAEERGNEQLFNRPAQVVASFLFLGLLVFGIIRATSDGVKGLKDRDDLRGRDAGVATIEERETAQQRRLPVAATGVSRLSRETERVGASLYRYASLPFEIASVLLLVAIVGSVLLARTTKQEVAVDDVDPDLLPELIAQEPELAAEGSGLAAQ